MVALVRLLFIGPLNPFADEQRRRKGNAGVIKVQPRARVQLAVEHLLIRSQSDYLQHGRACPLSINQYQDEMILE